mmetsp:Transcript_99105/g.314612  ORF Transcript_99105/g.314612 Transcript_99105/m.314612 type:complete len:227 (-) Transcript_99105:7-687(-)
MRPGALLLTWMVVTSVTSDAGSLSSGSCALPASAAAAVRGGRGGGGTEDLLGLGASASSATAARFDGLGADASSSAERRFAGLGAGAGAVTSFCSAARFASLGARASFSPAARLPGLGAGALLCRLRLDCRAGARHAETKAVPFRRPTPALRRRAASRAGLLRGLAFPSTRPAAAQALRRWSRRSLDLHRCVGISTEAGIPGYRLTATLLLPGLCGLGRGASAKMA